MTPFQPADNGGYIRLHRRLIDNPIYQHSAYLHVWIHLLLTANWKDQRMLDGTLIPRGSLPVGREKLAKTLGIPQNVVRRAFAVMKVTNMITIQSTKRGTVVTITNYEAYQTLENESHQRKHQPSHQQTTNRPPTDHQSRRREEGKKGRSKRRLRR